VSERALRRAICALALGGAGLAGYLTYVRYTGGVLACTSGGCELVQGSRYAEVAGVPVALIGLVGYLAIAAAAFLPGEPGAALGAALTVAGFAFGAYLIYVQVVLIDAICQWCLASDGVMTALLVLAALRLRAAVRSADRVAASEPRASESPSRG
jgi:uncharacterized membrane protein